jgi:hypothetical protein
MGKNQELRRRHSGLSGPSRLSAPQRRAAMSSRTTSNKRSKMYIIGHLLKKDRPFHKALGLN